MPGVGFGNENIQHGPLQKKTTGTGKHNRPSSETIYFRVWDISRCRQALYEVVW